MLKIDNKPFSCSDADEVLLSAIEQEDRLLFEHFASVIQESSCFSRSVVSFQANKNRPAYRWYKFKEAFSATLIEYLLENSGIQKRGVILDPFAGSGTTLFAAQAMGYNAEGIELLPIGQKIIQARCIVDEHLRQEDYARLKEWVQRHPWEKGEAKVPLNELNITKGAYPAATEKQIVQYLATAERETENIRAVLVFVLLCVLEEISYTRKDGQYLRWDYRSGRTNGTKCFDKGRILTFAKAIDNKLNQLLDDQQSPLCLQELFADTDKRGRLAMHPGSCLNVLPDLSAGCFDAIVTSPPYCNRYDYTRTYALELALLGLSEKELSSLRQQMLSCTVENREKDLLQINRHWDTALSIVSNLPLLQEIVSYLEHQKNHKKLNNNGIPRMVKGYFYEMACVIQESYRVLKRNALLIMVNDNVRYAGVSISVDTILSKIAEEIGFAVEKIYVLPGSKGNSSQQMGSHGRQPLRKCVYVWRKPR